MLVSTKMKCSRCWWAAALIACLVSRLATADNLLGTDEGKLLLTAGFNDLEGSGGGGLVPLAFITGYGSSDSWGANAHFTDIQLKDFQLRAFGVAVGALDRVEVSYTRHEFNITGTALDGLGAAQDIVGVKVKLIGDAVYGQDSWIPQLAVGAEYHKNQGLTNGDAVGLAGLVNPKQLGAAAEHGTDYYIAATKVFLAQSLVVNAVLRATKANEFGLLGFGGDLKNTYSYRPEGTVAYLLTRRLAVGSEIRTRPHNLSVDDETTAYTVFLAWAPTKNLSLVAAYLNIGGVLGPVTGVNRHQDGPYLSVQAGF
jgi:Protein of unknown function (DUF3034)